MFNSLGSVRLCMFLYKKKKKPSEIFIICWFGAQEKTLLIVYVENVLFFKDFLMNIKL